MAWQCTVLLAMVQCAAYVAGAGISLHSAGESRAYLEAYQDAPYEWELLHKADPHTAIELTFAVRQQNLDTLHRKLLAVSDADSSSYGQHLSLQEVNELVSPAESSLSALKDWIQGHWAEFNGRRNLRNSGKPPLLQRLTENADFMSLRTTVAHAEALLQTEYSYFGHKDVNDYKHRLLRSSSPYRCTLKLFVLSHLRPLTYGCLFFMIASPRS